MGDAISRIDEGRRAGTLRIGQRFVTAGRTVTEADLVAFVNLSWMNEELFTNLADRADLALPGRVVPGALVYAFAEGLVLPLFRGTGLAFLEARLDMRGPTCVGDTLRVEFEVIECRPSSKPERSLVRTRNSVVNQSGTTVLSYDPLRLMKT